MYFNMKDQIQLVNAYLQPENCCSAFKIFLRKLVLFKIV